MNGDESKMVPDKVARLQAMIANGEYHPDIREVARKLLREVLGDLMAVSCWS